MNPVDHRDQTIRELQADIELYRKRLASYETENESLRQRVGWLEASLTERVKIPHVFHLSAKEARVFEAIFRADLITRGEIMDFVYALEPSDVPIQKIVAVYIARIRRKIESHGVTIETVWGRGFRMSPADKKRVRELAENEK